MAAAEYSTRIWNCLGWNKSTNIAFQLKWVKLNMAMVHTSLPVEPLTASLARAVEAKSKAR